MKKILFMINSMGFGGAEKVTLDMINNLSPKKYDITLLTLSNNGDYEHLLAEHIHKKSLVTAKNKFLRRVLKYLFLFVIPPKVTYNLFIKKGYDVEIASLEGFPTKLIAEGKSNAKKYAWVHINLIKSGNSVKNYRSEAHALECYKRFDKIFCVSSGVRESFISKYGMADKTFVQFNVLDEKQVLDCSLEAVKLPTFNQGLKLISVGRLAEQKGFDRLIKVLGKLAKENKEFHLTLVGDGPEREKLTSLALENGISDRVSFLGFQANPHKFVIHHDLFVCSSHTEGFSTVATEAIILKLPVISTDCTGMEDLLENGKYGMVVENSEEGLYQGLKQIFDSPSILEELKAVAKVRSSYFTMDKRIKEIEAILDT